MRRAVSMTASLLAAAALIGSPSLAPASEPEKIGTAFEVRMAPGAGGPQVEVTFALVHSDVSTYPVTITAISGPVEEQLWEGTLPEGLYRFRGTLKKITSGPVRLVLKTRMRNLDAAGNQSYHSYLRWDGTLSR